MKYNTVKLGEYLYIKGRIGWKGLKKKEYLPEGDYRIINGESLTTNGIDWSNAGYITEERYNESPEIMLAPNDILISKDGTIGKIGFVKNVDKPTTVASGIFVVRNLRPTEINTRFIYHFLTSSYFKNFITMRTEGSVISHLYQKDFVELDFPLPEMELQNKIVGILDSIDQKIDLNKETNENLLQQAQALFKNRFLINDNLPDNWMCTTLGDVSEMSAGGDKPKKISYQKTEDCPYPIYSNGISDEGLYGFTTDYKISAESVTVSARGTIGFVCLRHLPYTPIVRLVTLVPHKSIISAKYLYLWLKNIPIHGTGTTQQQLTVPDFRKTEIIIPTEAEMMSFTETVNPLFQRMWLNQEENIKLAKLRDTLLPKLMSGELDVSDLDL